MLGRFIIGCATFWGAMMGFFVGIAFGTVTSLSFFFMQTTWFLNEEILTIVKHHTQHMLAKHRRSLSRSAASTQRLQDGTPEH
jgi:hypothetical protein